MRKKTAEDIEKISKACRISKLILEKLGEEILPGISTKKLEIFADDLMKCYNTNSAFKGYRGYPASICVSVNEEIVHGIPSEKRILKEGDLVSCDIGVRYEGFCGDCAATFVVGEAGPDRKRLVDATREALAAGISKAAPGNRVGDISAAIMSVAEKYGFSVVREFAGHGLGRSLHEEPEVPNFGYPGTGKKLEENMVIAIEPMLNMGRPEVKILSDGWTAVTIDGQPSAHFEDALRITAAGSEILTKTGQ